MKKQIDRSLNIFLIGAAIVLIGVVVEISTSFPIGFAISTSGFWILFSVSIYEILAHKYWILLTLTGLVGGLLIILSGLLVGIDLLIDIGLGLGVMSLIFWFLSQFFGKKPQDSQKDSQDRD